MVRDEEDLNPEDESQDEPEQLRDTGPSDDEEKPIEQVPSLGTAGDSETVYMPRVDPDNRPEPLDEDDAGEPAQVEDDSPQEDEPESEQRIVDSNPDEVQTGGSEFKFQPSDQLRIRNANLPEQPPASPPVPPLKTAGEQPSRDEDRKNLGRMSYYKRKNLDKGKEVPGVEKGEDGVHREKPAMGSGEERDEEGLRQQRQIPTEQLNIPSGGPLGVDLQPDIVPDLGVDGASSFKPDGQDSTQVLNDVQSAADAVDTLTVGILNVLARLTLNMRKANDNIRQLMDKLEVEDHRDEF